MVELGLFSLDWINRHFIIGQNISIENEDDYLGGKTTIDVRF